MPNIRWLRKNSSDHWSCWSPPGVPNARYGSPSRSARLGLSVVRGRLPGASVAGSPGVRVNICARVPRQKPSPGMTGELCSQPPLGVAATRFPNRSATSRWQATTLDMSGVDYITAPRDVSPVISRLRVEPSFNTDLEWAADYDTKAGRWAASNVFADYRHGNFFSGLGHSLLNAVGETPEPPTQPANFVNYNQMQLLLGYGAITKPGFSAAAKGNFSLEGRALEYGGIQATYNRNCCGLTVEVQRFALGAVRNETSTTFNLSLSGVAAVGSLVRA